MNGNPFYSYSGDLSSSYQPSNITMSEMFNMGPEPPKAEEESTQSKAAAQEEPSAPYFYYRDHSHLPDPDPTKPVTIPGRIPTFPAKLFAILSRSDLADIISWMPHGRSWKVHKPREFEVKVIPSYFDHAKFSSFIRQANGWGFKRICTKGVDRNSHYHELFLRGMPHLIKFMKRPVSGSKLPSSQPPKGTTNSDPDLYAISNEHPLPEFTPKMLHPLDESSFLNSANNNRMQGSYGSACGRPLISTNQQSLSPLDGQMDQMQMTQLQSFFAQQDSFHMPEPTPVAQNQPFLLPRMAENKQQQPQTVTSAPQQQMMPTPSEHCPVRLQEKELDPLTILMNDVYEDTTIDDPIIQSLIADPTVPPPSSLSKPSTTVYEQMPIFWQHSMFGAPSMNVVTPVHEKEIIQLLPEPAYVNTQPQFHHDEGINDDFLFEDPFAGGLAAQDFFNSLVA
jgi:hypothetical protein